MKTRLLAAFSAVICLFIWTPLAADYMVLGCPGPKGPGPVGPGLYITDLISDEGIEVGTVDTWNTKDKIFFELHIISGIQLTDVQLWAGPDLDLLPAKVDKKTGVRKPAYNKFDLKWDSFDAKQDHLIEVDLWEDLGYGLKGGKRRWSVFLHGDFVYPDSDEPGEGFLAYGPCPLDGDEKQMYPEVVYHVPDRGHFIDAPVKGVGYATQTQYGVLGYSENGEESDRGSFPFFPGEDITFMIGSVELGMASAAKRVSPLDFYAGADATDPRVIGIARTLQTLDDDQTDGKILLRPLVVSCFEMAVGALGLDSGGIDWGDSDLIDALLSETLAQCDGNPEGIVLEVVSAEEAQGNLEAGLNASGIFRKNVSKTEDWGETKQKLEVMPVYFPGLRSNGDPSLCVDVDDDKIYDEADGDQLGVPYEEWRLGGDPLAAECDPREYEDPLACQITLIECRDVAKPLLVTYLAKVDIYDDQVKEDFWPGRFSWDVFTAVSRDDGTTWKRRNLSRMADMSSFDLETGEPFPGTAGTPYLKVNDNKILVAWQSKFCKSGQPRYSINLCDDPDTEEEPYIDSETGELVCEEYCTGNPDKGTEVCEPDYPHDDDYYITDIWGVRGNQRSVDYNEVDDVDSLGIGEIPYSCLWTQRGVIVSQKELSENTLRSVNGYDDECTAEGVPFACCTGEGTGPTCAQDLSEANCTAEGTPYDCCTGDGTGECEVGLGDIVWFKPERLTSGRRDVFVPVIGSARGAGFAIAWQADPSGLRPGKGKGPGEGWSGAISNHKTDMWYSFISYDDFNIVDENFVPGGPGSAPTGNQGYLDKPGLGRPKARVPFSLPVRITDNDMVNTHTLKVEPSSQCVTPPGGTEPACFPEVVDGSFVPIEPDEIAKEFCDHEESDPATCCDPDNHEGDPNCEDLKGFFGNLTGTKRYAYMAKTIDEYGFDADDNYVYMPGGDGTPDYEYYEARGGTLDLCDLSGGNTYMDVIPPSVPGTQPRWYGFTNAAGASKLVCTTSDGRLLDGDTFASRPMLQLQPYTKGDGTKSAWALLAYEESKGMGHSLAAAEHEETDNPVDEIIGDSGQEKPVKQDIGKNMMYHSFDFAQPDLVAPGHIVNLPALCGGLYPTYCDDPKTPDVIETDEDNPTCTCDAGQPVPVYFDYETCTDPNDPATCEWLPDDTKFLQYRTEIARRARFLMQSPGKMGDTNTLGAIIYKQGQEGQGRPADVFIRRFVKSGTGNPYKFENIECSTYLRDTFALPACPNGAGDKDSAVGYNCNVWGEATGDLLCGGTFYDSNGGYSRRDHINLTSADIDLAVDAGPVDDTPDDPTDDRYGTNKVLLWSQHEYNLGDESYGYVNKDSNSAGYGEGCDVLNGDVCPAMYSNARSHRGFIRGDLMVTAFSLSPNWAAGRNGNDRYNFYVRRSFDGGQTWTTDPAGDGVYVCPEYRSDPNNPDPDGSGNLPPQVLLDAASGDCGKYDPPPEDELPPLPVGIAMSNYLEEMTETSDFVSAQYIGPNTFEPARNVSELKNNHESSGDPRLGTTPPTYPLDGTALDSKGNLKNLCPQGDCFFVEDSYVNNMFFVAWGTVDNAKSTGSTGVKAEAGPLDLFYTRTENYGDTYLKIPWVIGGVNSNQGYGETVWRYDFVAKGEPEEQGEAQLRATSDGSKAYVIWHSQISAEEDPDEVYTRWYPWKPSESSENDLWFRRVIFWPDAPDPIQ